MSDSHDIHLTDYDSLTTTAAGFHVLAYRKFWREEILGARCYEEVITLAEARLLLGQEFLPTFRAYVEKRFEITIDDVMQPLTEKPGNPCLTLLDSNLGYGMGTDLLTICNQEVLWEGWKERVSYSPSSDGEFHDRECFLAAAGLWEDEDWHFAIHMDLIREIWPDVSNSRETNYFFTNLVHQRNDETNFVVSYRQTARVELLHGCGVSLIPILAHIAPDGSMYSPTEYERFREFVQSGVDMALPFIKSK